MCCQRLRTTRMCAAAVSSTRQHALPCPLALQPPGELAALARDPLLDPQRPAPDPADDWRRQRGPAAQEHLPMDAGPTNNPGAPADQRDAEHQERDTGAQ